MKSSLTHLVVALLICVAALASYSAWYAAVSAKSAAVADLQEQIETKTETINRVAAARAMLAEIADDETVVRGYFVPETSVVPFIDALEAQGESQGAAISVRSVSTGGTSARPTLELSLSVAGTFDAVMRTIGLIEYAPYDLMVASLSVAQDDKDNWQADLKIVVGSVPASRAASPGGADALQTPPREALPTARIPSSSPYVYF